MSRRARAPEAKLARRHALLEHAAGLLDARPQAPLLGGHGEALTMARLAGRAGLARATLYLYFDSKEAVLLALLSRELETWQRAIELELAGLESCGRDALAGRISASLAARARLRRLISIIPTALGGTLAREHAPRFRRELRRQLVPVAFQLERLCPTLVAGAGLGLLLATLAQLIGLQALCEPRPTPPTPAKSLPETPERRLFRLDLEQELRRALRALLEDHNRHFVGKIERSARSPKS